MPRTNRSNSTSQQSASSSQPTWAPPRSPLPPHRLAKLANALGVPTPVPATHAHSFTMAHSPDVASLSPSPSPNPSDILRRSPTPSAASMPPTPNFSTSKFMLHVVPPGHLPHDSDDLDLTPPPPTASGYHPQFRRGVLVPVYSTLYAQFSAIAREYGLPSTSGMVLYLITSNIADDSHEPGPRISEDIWRHIWTRVLKVEKEELLASGHKPLGLGLGYGLASRSSPTLHQDVSTSSSPLQASSYRPFMQPRLTETPQPNGRATTPSPSTSHSAYSSLSELDTPESATSVDPPTHANSLPLPGLDSNAPLPVLAKVEFDIDKRRAGWYDTWVRSRRVNHAKRAESRISERNGSRSDSQMEETEEGTKKAPIDLALVERMNSAIANPNFILTTETSAEPEQLSLDDGFDEGYQPLPDEDAEKILDDELAARLDSSTEDPLEDVFGSDADTWATMHQAGHCQPIPNVVNLAINAAEVSDLPVDLEADDADRLSIGNDETEVVELLNKMTRPVLSVTISETRSTPTNRQSTPTTAGPLKRPVPPPLDLQVPFPKELVVAEQATPVSSGPETAHLAYLADDDKPHTASEIDVRLEVDDDESTEEELLAKARSPEDEKRVGVFYDALNLGLDASLMEDGDFDDSDPYDRRKSQYIMAAQLDEIERNLAQFSPRILQSDELNEDLSPTLSHANRSPSIASMLTPRNSEFPIPINTPGLTSSTWPAVPYSTLNGSGFEEGGSGSRPNSPPSFAFNGISTEPPKSPYAKQNRLTPVSDETLGRQRALQEDSGLYPPLMAPLMFGRNRDEDSPVIPLSPDPFGRYPSEAEASYIAEERHSQLYLDDPLAQESFIGTPPERGSSLGLPTAVEQVSRPPSQAPSSRFSLDSNASEEPARVVAHTLAPKQSGLMGVKSIRKLWRKSESKRSSISAVFQTGSGRTSPNAAITTIPENSQPTGRSRSKSISKASHMPETRDELPAPNFPPPRHSRDNSLQTLRFDQESPYPIHPARAGTIRSPSPPPAVSRPSSSYANRPPSISQPFPSSAPAAPSSPPERGSVRKSILKSWKSTNGLSSAANKGSMSKATGSSSTTPRSSTEHLPDTKRKRRPSVLDIAGGIMRSSMSSGSVTLVDIPPSPAIPEQFVEQVRSSSRQSQTYANSKQNAWPTSSPPRVRSPLSPGSPPQNSNSLSASQQRTSIDSYESRPSFDISQFEMVSPPKTMLTYPYHGLDSSRIPVQEQ